MIPEPSLTAPNPAISPIYTLHNPLPEAQSTSFFRIPDLPTPTPQFPFDATTITYELAPQPAPSFKQILLYTLCSHFSLPEQNASNFLDLLFEKLSSLQLGSLPQNYEAILINCLQNAHPLQHVPIFTSFLVTDTALPSLCDLIASLLQCFVPRSDRPDQPSDFMTFWCAIICASHIQQLIQSNPEHAIKQITKIVKNWDRMLSHLQNQNKNPTSNICHLLMSFYETLITHLATGKDALCTLLREDHSCTVYHWLVFNFSCRGNTNIVNAINAVLRFSERFYKLFTPPQGVTFSFVLLLLTPRLAKAVDLDVLYHSIEKYFEIFRIVLLKESSLGVEIKKLFQHTHFHNLFAKFLKNLLQQNTIPIAGQITNDKNEKIFPDKGTPLLINNFRLCVELYKQFQAWYSVPEFEVLSVILLCRIRLTEKCTIQEIQTFLNSLHQCILSCGSLIDGNSAAFTIIHRLINFQMEENILLTSCTDMLNIYRTIFTDAEIQRIRLSSLENSFSTSPETCDTVVQLLSSLSFSPIFNPLTNRWIPYTPPWSSTDTAFNNMRIAKMKYLFKRVLELVQFGASKKLNPIRIIAFVSKLLKETEAANLDCTYIDDIFQCIQNIFEHAYRVTTKKPKIRSLLSSSFEVLFLIYPYGLPEGRTRTTLITTNNLAKILVDSTRMANICVKSLNCTIEKAFNLVATLMQQDMHNTLFRLGEISEILKICFKTTNADDENTLQTFLDRFPSVEAAAEFLSTFLLKQNLSEERTQIIEQIKQAIYSQQVSDNNNFSRWHLLPRNL